MKKYIGTQIKVWREVTQIKKG